MFKKGGCCRMKKWTRSCEVGETDKIRIEKSESRSFPRLDCFKIGTDLKIGNVKIICLLQV